jgi:hypothetical protein
MLSRHMAPRIRLRHHLRICWLSLAATLPAQAVVPAPKLFRHPYLQMATQTSITLVWRTRGPSRPVVRYGEQPDRLNLRVPAAQITLRLALNVAAPDIALRLHSAPNDTHQYEAVITGLNPDRKYYYAVHDGDERLAGADEDHRFHTLPIAGKDRALRFWVLGDSGTGNALQRLVFTAMQTFMAKEKRKFDGFLHVGDMAYGAGKDAEFQVKFFKVYSPLLRHTVCWPSMGNHEGGTSRGMTGIGPYYDAYVLPTKAEAGGLPSGKEAFYSFDFGNVHFVCLDSHDLSRKPDGEMALWLRADLERTKAKFLIAYWHHPPYTLGSHDSNVEHQLVEMRTHIMPILESGGVDLVLSGHSHIYERSMLIDGAYVTPTTTDGVVLDDGDGDPQGDGPYRKSEGLKPHRGTVAIVAGNGGANVSRLGTMPIMRRIFLEHGSVILDVEKDTLTVRMLNGLGVIRDRFQIVKKGEVAREVVLHPWSGLGPRIGALGSEFATDVLVELVARPPAPDARIHYTLDKTEPTLRSPIYERPMTLARDTTVKAFSVWNRGKRISPVSTREFSLLPPGVFMRRLLSSADDVEEGPDGKITAKDHKLEIAQLAKKQQWVGLRFVKIRIPKGAKIKLAAVQFTCRAKTIGEAALKVYMPSAEPFDTSAHCLSKRAATAPSVEWIPEPWLVASDASRAQQTPNLAGLLQKIVDAPDWKSGNAVAVVITGTGKRTAVAYDRMAKYAPFLWVEYEER